MKKNEGKVGAALLIIALILLFACAGSYGYMYITKLEDRILTIEQENNKQATMVETTQTENDTDVIGNNNTYLNTGVKTSDLVTFYCDVNDSYFQIFYAYLEDGELYYYNVFSEKTEKNGKD